jgi:molybdenum cofactor synthesis domain-containing protein
MDKYKAAVITVSDKGSRGERTDTSGPAVAQMLTQAGFAVEHTSIVPDEIPQIAAELRRCADELHTPLIITTGGTGFTRRDVTPEAVKSVITRETPGFSEIMRAESFKVTPNGILSRGISGIYGDTLIITLPGSEKAAKECLSFILPSLGHAMQMLLSDAVEHGTEAQGRVIAVCISEEKGVQKTPRAEVTLIEQHGLEGDGHAGDWHRQVSLLSKSSVDKLQEKVDFQLAPGAFAENIWVDGIDVKDLPVGTKVKIGGAVLEITQIGKECHYDCVIRQKAGDCVMPREGVFARVLAGGRVRAGDIVAAAV